MKFTLSIPAFFLVVLVGAILLAASPAFAQLGDVTPPVISAVVAASVSSVAESVTWLTNELAISTLEYGVTQSYGSHASISASLAIGGTAALTGLSPGTTYYYCIHATDASTNASSHCGNFVTPTLADQTPPVVSAVIVASLATSTATITWTSDELSSSQIQYGLTSSYDSSSTLNTNPTFLHSTSLSGLTPNTTYHYRVKSVDAAGNIALGADATFTTASISVVVSDTTPPVISGAAESSIAATNATIIWETDELATSSLEYGLTSGYGSHAAFLLSTGLVHTATILNLQPNATYYYCIHATDLFGNVANSCGHSFVTAAMPFGGDANPPTISLITVASVATSSATISWTTDEVANARVEYGLSADYDANSSLDTSFALTHSTTLTGLLPNTLYHYRVRSSDETGNLAVSSDETFTTAAISGSSSGGSGGGAPSTVILSSIETASISTSTVTVTWATNLPSDSQVEYGVSELFGQTTPLSGTPTTSHSATISGLAPNTNYIFRVKSKPVGASLATVSESYEFNTLSEAQPAAQAANILSVAATSTTSSGTNVSWSTDVGANGRVEYGITTAYGETSATSSALTTSHAITLANLDPDTTYHYRVRSVTAAGDITLSSDHNFTTGAAPGGSGAPAAPSAILNLTVPAHDHYSATLAWNAASVYSDAALEYDVRYNTSPITQESFITATRAQSTPIVYADLSPSGTGRTYIVAGLNQNTTYYFAIKAKHVNSDWSLVSNVVSATTATVASKPASGNSAASSANGGGGSTYGGVTPPTLLNAAGEDSGIAIAWKNPNDPNFVRTVIIRKEGGYPMFPTDGQVIYEGRSETYTDTDVQNGKTYYYSIYSYDHLKQYSNPVRVSLAPQIGKSQEILRETPELVSVSPEYHFVRTFKRGDKDIEIEHLQQLLSIDQNIPHQGFTTGYFGRKTEAAMKRFQAGHNLPQTGVTDTATQALLNTLSKEQVKLAVPEEQILFANDLRYGQQGDAVEALQEFLVRESSYKEALVSGYFGTYTRNAVTIFQRKYGVQPISGYVGPKTRHVMRTISGL